MKNKIQNSAFIDENVEIGEFNTIGENVQIKYLNPEIRPRVTIGDNNIFNDNTRILVGSHPVSIGDWNVFHNDMLLMGGKGLSIGHNCWFGQNTILDGAGGLFIHNGVRVGMYSQIWTHVASGELLEGCLLFGERETVLEDDVWLVGSCVVSSGVHLKNKSVFLINSVITKDSKPKTVYSGSPAQVNEKINIWRNVELDEKLEMMLNWAILFCEQNSTYKVLNHCDLGYFEIVSEDFEEGVLIFASTEDFRYKSNTTSFFSLIEKTFTKKNSRLERQFYKFIYNHKARFLPITDLQ